MRTSAAGKLATERKGAETVFFLLLHTEAEEAVTELRLRIPVLTALLRAVAASAERERSMTARVDMLAAVLRVGEAG